MRIRERFAYDHLSVLRVCKHYQVTRQAYYKSQTRDLINRFDREKLHMLVMESRKELPREGGHKLYKRIRPKLQQMGIKVGRDMLFTFLGNNIDNTALRIFILRRCGSPDYFDFFNITGCKT